MFEPLSQTDIREILRMQMRDLQEKLSENGVTIEFTQEFEDYPVSASSGALIIKVGSSISRQRST